MCLVELPCERSEACQSPRYRSPETETIATNQKRVSVVAMDTHQAELDDVSVDEVVEGVQ